MLKTRMVLNTEKQISGLNNFFSSIKDIYHEHGVIGYWRGVVISLPLCFNGVITMYAFEMMMKYSK